MSSKQPSQQLAFDWDLPEEESNAALSAEEIQARKDIAQAMLENPASWPKVNGKPQKPFWFDHYLSLLSGVRAPFRAAVLAAWLATPKKHRWPKTQEELADLLGMGSDRQFAEWRRKNEKFFADTIQGAWKERVMDGLADSVDAMLEVASRADYKSVRAQELHFRMADLLKNTLTLTDERDFSKMSWVEKMREIGLDTPEKMTAYLEEQTKARLSLEEQDEPTLDDTQP